MPSDRLKRHANLKNLTFAFALVLFVWVVWYCYTGFGGPQELVSRLLPIALVLQILFMYQNEFLYKWLPAIANHVLVVVYIGICVYAFVYFYLYFEDQEGHAGNLLRHQRRHAPMPGHVGRRPQVRQRPH